MKKITSFFMAVYFSIFAFLGIPFSSPDLEVGEMYQGEATEEQMALFTQIYETETAYLASMQLPNGALPMTYAKNGELTVNPYFADFAALALLDNAEEYADEVVKYMDWHFSHLNTKNEDFNKLDGTIYDYKVTMKNGEVVSERVSTPENADSYDTTDSYAATFLTVVYKYFCKTGDIDYLIKNAKDLERITNVMLATEQNGLTYAKPNHLIKYLMDNCEVYEGFIAAQRIFEQLVLRGMTEYTDLCEDCSELYDTIQDNINTKMWNFTGQHYRTALIAYLGVPRKVFSWDLYYPQATSQLFPIICGVIEPGTDRAKHVYEQFCEHYHWEAFDYPDDFYWGANVQAAAIMNDLDSVVEYMENYLPLTEKHSWPLYNMDIARTAMAAKIMIDRNTAGEEVPCH